MISSSLETVFISNPVYSDDDAFRRCVGVRSLRNGTNFFGFRSNLLLASAFLYLGSISALETVGRISCKNYTIVAYGF